MGLKELNDELWEALEWGFVDEIETCLRKGADINDRDSKGKTPIIWACENGDFHIVRCLARNKAKLNERDNRGKTALMYAYEKGFCDIWKYLAEDYYEEVFNNRIKRRKASIKRENYNRARNMKNIEMM